MLPIFDILDSLSAKIPHTDHIIVAPPGAGKSTALPLHLLQNSAISTNKIIMLQPRRIAARNIAIYLAKQLGEQVGQRVGYRIRGETKVSQHTQLEIVTEGVLTRMLQSEPELPGVGLIIFDEFHERSIHADFSLALSLEVQQALRDDLRILVMSATLDIEALQKLMPAAALLTSEGRSYPIETVHLPRKKQPLSVQVSHVVSDIYAKHEQDILVFLPGKYEINKVASLLEQSFSQKPETSPEIHCLYSDLSKHKQDAALLPSSRGKRKVVLATNIAETSLTIEGIEVVVDSGVEKKAIFDLRKGITHLATNPISQASATQRAGRAGRLMPGTAYRLWSKELHSRLARQSTPEIRHSALDSFLLEAMVWGSRMNELSLIDIPSDAQLAQAQDNLLYLGLIHRPDSSAEKHGVTSQNAIQSHSIDQKLKVSDLGRRAHELGASPNIAVMLLKSAELSSNHQSLACAIATLLENKDPLSGGNQAIQSVSLSERLRFLQQNKSHSLWQAIGLWQKKCGLAKSANANQWPLEDSALLLAFASPYWLAKLRSNGSYSLVNGNGAKVNDSDPLAQSDWIAIATMHSLDKPASQFSGDRQSSAAVNEAIVRLAEPISFAQLEKYFPDMLNQQELAYWDENKKMIASQEITYFGKVVIKKRPTKKPSDEQILDIWKSLLSKKCKDEGLSALPLNEKTKSWLAKARMLGNVDSSFPDFSEPALLASFDVWLFPYLSEVKTWKAFAELPFLHQLKSLLNYQEQVLLDQEVPESFAIPTGRKVAIDYRDNGKAVVSVRMQEVYGLGIHPRILNNSLALTFELLSPAQRPIQTTDDIVGFFKGSYSEVQKEMKGRYPRHFWPDDPLNATPTTTTKKRMLKS